MNVFDRFLTGDLENIEICFENRHFLERLKENGISRDYIVECIYTEEPRVYEHIKSDKYSVVYNAPANKDYKEIRVIMACKNNSIDLITVMRNNETTTNRQNKQYQSKRKKEIEKKRFKALSKRKKMY